VAGDTSQGVGSVFDNGKGSLDAANIAAQDPGFRANADLWKKLIDMLKATGIEGFNADNLAAAINNANNQTGNSDQNLPITGTTLSPILDWIEQLQKLIAANGGIGDIANTGGGTGGTTGTHPTGGSDVTPTDHGGGIPGGISPPGYSGTGGSGSTNTDNLSALEKAILEAQKKLADAQASGNADAIKYAQDQLTVLQQLLAVAGGGSAASTGAGGTTPLSGTEDVGTMLKQIDDDLRTAGNAIVDAIHGVGSVGGGSGGTPVPTTSSGTPPVTNPTTTPDSQGGSAASKIAALQKEILEAQKELKVATSSGNADAIRSAKDHLEVLQKMLDTLKGSGAGAIIPSLQPTISETPGATDKYGRPLPQPPATSPPISETPGLTDKYGRPLPQQTLPPTETPGLTDKYGRPLPQPSTHPSSGTLPDVPPPHGGGLPGINPNPNPPTPQPGAGLPPGYADSGGKFGNLPAPPAATSAAILAAQAKVKQLTEEYQVAYNYRSESLTRAAELRLYEAQKELDALMAAAAPSGGIPVPTPTTPPPPPIPTIRPKPGSPPPTVNPRDTIHPLPTTPPGTHPIEDTLPDVPPPHGGGLPPIAAPSQPPGHPIPQGGKFGNIPELHDSIMTPKELADAFADAWQRKHGNYGGDAPPIPILSGKAGDHTPSDLIAALGKLADLPALKLPPVPNLKVPPGATADGTGGGIIMHNPVFNLQGIQNPRELWKQLKDEAKKLTPTAVPYSQ